METSTAIVLAVAVVVVAVLAYLLLTRRRNEQLQGKYGPEYQRLVRTEGQRQASREISRREKRVESLHVRPLASEERDRFSNDWQHTQARFVDDPVGSVTEADRLVGSLMTTRGYPVAEFEQRAADISVDHPLVVEHYRVAHDIALRHQARQASTEDLRQALVHYRALFSELLEQREPATT